MEYKGFKIVSDGTFSMYTIQQLGSGTVPQALKGSFTNTASAKVAIDRYEPKRGAKKHGKTDATD